ncbi:TF2AY factor, partial [Penelope pileata]|nr:TF2AY factor [Penelope pileata]
MAHGNPVPKLYKSIIEDVIENIQELFAEEGVDKQVLKNLKELWETKVMQSKATEGFFRHSHHSPRFALQLPHNFHHILQASAASLVIPAGRGFQHFMAADLGASRAGAALTLPSSIAYPIHVPTGVTLQATSGQLYKVNVPVMVTHGQGDASVLQHPVQQVLQSIGQPSVLQTNVASVAQVKAPPVQAAAEMLQIQKTSVQQTMVYQPGALQNKHPENSTKTILFQQPTVSQQQTATSAVLNQHVELTEKSQGDNLPTAVFTSGSSEVLAPDESLANDPGSVLLPDVEGQLDTEPQESAQQQVSDIIELIIMGKSLDDNTARKDQESGAPTDKVAPTVQVESNLQSEKGICSDIEDIIQLDGSGDASPKEEILHSKDKEENEFIDIIESEDLKALEEEEEDEECDSVSDAESSSSSCDNEEPHTDVVEEDPLNSDDDVSDLDIADLFDTNNVIVCQYEKIHRSKNKWKFFLKDGVMSFDGKDYVFAKAVGDAEW